MGFYLETTKTRVGCLPRLAVTKQQKRLWCCAHRSLNLHRIFPGRVNRIFDRGVHQQAASADLRTSAPVTKGAERGAFDVSEQTPSSACLPFYALTDSITRAMPRDHLLSVNEEKCSPQYSNSIELATKASLPKSALHVKVWVEVTCTSSFI